MKGSGDRGKSAWRTTSRRRVCRGTLGNHPVPIVFGGRQTTLLRDHVKVGTTEEGAIGSRSLRHAVAVDHRPGVKKACVPLIS